MYKVATGHKDGRAYHWFAKFLAYEYDLELDYDLQDALNRLNIKATISEYHTIGDDMFFETEEDFTMFLLRYS